MLSHDEVLSEFRTAGALLEGHFILSSGLHSSRYLQCARVLMDPKRADRLCQSLRARITDKIRNQIDIVASPAMGGVVGLVVPRSTKRFAVDHEREKCAG